MAKAFASASSQYMRDTTWTAATGFPCTIAGWFYMATAGAGMRMFSLKVDSAGNENTFNLNNNGTTDVRAQFRNSANTAFAAVSTSGPSTTTWHHIAGVFAAANDIRVFLDGGSKGTDTSGSGSLGAALDVAALACFYKTAPSNFWNGNLAEFAVWGAALTDAQVAVLATAISPMAVEPLSLAAYWPLMGLIVTEPSVFNAKAPMVPSGGPTAADHPRITYNISPMLSKAPTAAASPLSVNIAYDNESIWNSGVRVYGP